MYKSVLRAAPRYALPSRSVTRSSGTRRFLSTGPAAQTRSWTNSGVRWGLALGAVYVYSTSSVFAEEPEAAVRRLDDSILAVQESNQPTLDAIVEEKRRREAQQAAEEREMERQARVASAEVEEEGEEGEEGMDGLADEADSQGAFNPETGEINWDCPCLGGMAHGPCGEEFKAAFSCFVYSNEEPKGIECIDKFKGMQDCFRQHPDMYGSELQDDEDEVEQELLARENGSSGEAEEPLSEKSVASTPVARKTSEPTEEKAVEPETARGERKLGAEETSKAAAEASTRATNGDQDNSEKDDELIPKAAHDATRR